MTEDDKILRADETLESIEQTIRTGKDDCLSSREIIANVARVIRNSERAPVTPFDLPIWEGPDGYTGKFKRADCA